MEFVKTSILKAQQYNYDGYTVDFEPVSPMNITQLTDFVLFWGQNLQQYNLSLSLWINYNQYDDRTFAEQREDEVRAIMKELEKNLIQ